MNNGLTALGPGATDLLRCLDGIFEGWGHGDGAVSMIMPPLLPVRSLARLDFYQNFPHQAMLVSSLDMSKRQSLPADGETGEFDTFFLEPAQLALPSAACFGVYLHYEGQQLPGDTLVTVLGRCFRREDHYVDLRRLLGFHMREVVAMGSQEFVEAHLLRFSDRVAAFAAALDLPLRKDVATDPFFDGESPRALLQRLSPVKHEFLAGDMAIASVNMHRNFFGDRCAITLAPEANPVFTSCAAFGLERWLSALFERFGDWEEAQSAVLKASSNMDTKGVLL
ncbi:hypothetical protein Lfu02_02110 [Longispora fulva]|uniref:Seryl-tRNA synthetase n=1 Tax=Longispora fulva TaxID=619741 RepID=A0A8J7G8Z6_9ACTN|nr:hypothetical protein [Longispora fulva]MBG6135918.1 seryl-tRNA synthetase [Longispora fulva]GIG55839.1 hypothetical protein Lfu02_02110 [Longispora fulva]